MSALPTPPKKSLPVRRRAEDLSNVVGAFESETQAVLARTAPRRQHIVLYFLTGMLVLTIVLAAVVKLDRVVTGGGRIVPRGGQLYVSPFDTGIVRRVHVRAGDVVKKGQVLATLDPTFAHADVAQLEQKLESDTAAVARLEAELAGTPYQPTGTDPSTLLQVSIWQKRQAEYRSNLTDFDSKIHSAESQVAQYESDVRQYTKRLKLADEVEHVYQPLLEKGYVSKLQVMQANDDRTEMNRLLADAENQMKALRQLVVSQQSQREAFIQKWHSDTGTELVATRSDLEQNRQNLQKAQKVSDLVTLTAPADAVVLKVGKVSSGSVAGSGALAAGGQQDPLFTLVPLDAPVEIEVHVRAEDIGFVKAGDPVAIKLDAYRFMQHGTAKGVITTVSEGSFTRDDNDTPTPPYFKVFVKVTDAHLRNVPKDFRLIPGMTVQGDILVGSRTILSYLVEGSLRTGAEAMREPQ